MLHVDDTIGAPEALDVDCARALVDLVRADVLAARAYRAAIDALDPALAPLIARLRACERDHLRHVDELSSALRQSGRDVARPRRSPRGAFVAGVTALASRLGPEASLRSLLELERRTCARCDELAACGFPPGSAALAARWCVDERRHLDFLDGTLRLRAWDGAGARSSSAQEPAPSWSARRAWPP